MFTLGFLVGTVLSLLLRSETLMMHRIKHGMTKKVFPQSRCWMLDARYWIKKNNSNCAVIIADFIQHPVSRNQYQGNRPRKLRAYLTTKIPLDRPRTKQDNE